MWFYWFFKKSHSRPKIVLAVKTTVASLCTAAARMAEKSAPLGKTVEDGGRWWKVPKKISHNPKTPHQLLHIALPWAI